MSLLITGSIGIDTVETPYGKVTDVIGGTAIYSSLAAVPYGPVRLVGVVGEDFPEDALAPLQAREIDLAGLERRAGSKAFRWPGRAGGAWNEAQTVVVAPHGVVAGFVVASDSSISANTPAISFIWRSMSASNVSGVLFSARAAYCSVWSQLPVIAFLAGTLAICGLYFLSSPVVRCPVVGR